MELNQFIEMQLGNKNMTREALIQAIGMNRGTFYNKMRRNEFDVSEFRLISIALGFNPNDYFKSAINENEINSETEKHLIASEPQNKYGKPLDKKGGGNSETMVHDLLQQNMKLIAIIENLTKTAQ